MYTCGRRKSRLSNLVPIISAHDLSKKFGVAPLFKNISFTVSEGDRIGLIGPNGWARPYFAPSKLHAAAERSIAGWWATASN